MANFAAFPNFKLPVSRESNSNSSVKVPAPAREATVVSFGGMPCNKLTVPYGMPDAVLKAYTSLLPISVANFSRNPSYAQVDDFLVVQSSFSTISELGAE